jgi:bud site selection protein 31
MGFSTIELQCAESQWPVHQISWQRSRYIYDLYYTYNKISREVYDYCVNNKIVDPALIAKWKKPGYERLCSTYAINPRNYKFGTVSICRVPKSSLTAVSIHTNSAAQYSALFCS